MGAAAVPFFLKFAVIFGLSAALLAADVAEGRRAFFVFGDSLVDNGNNNFLATSARADSPPYGIDYPTHRPTGRFSNGLNIPDIISEKLGSEPTMPYLNPQLDGQKLLVGANFASAGVGILNDTGIQFLDYFAEYQQRLAKLIGAEKAKKLVNDALVLITLGGNDFVNNYYLIPFSPRSRQFTLPNYVDFVISEYKKVLKRLYDLGARKVMVTGTGPLGCVPAELAQHSLDGKCASELQNAAYMFNPKLVRIIKCLNRELNCNAFLAVNTHQIHMDFITNPKAFGFVTSQVACCGQGPYNGMGLCTPLSHLCTNRDEYAFWDAFHPSEKANRIIVDQMMSGSNTYMHPMNLSTILAMDSNA
nr:GDSL esterase/lipase At5g33370-like [Ipomoea trifida]